MTDSPGTRSRCRPRSGTGGDPAPARAVLGAPARMTVPPPHSITSSSPMPRRRTPPRRVLLSSSQRHHQDRQHGVSRRARESVARVGRRHAPKWSPASAVEFGIQVPENRYARDGPNGFLEEFELLGESLGGNRIGGPSDVSAWPGETRDETLTNRIGARGGHDNRNSRPRDFRCLPSEPAL